MVHLTTALDAASAVPLYEQLYQSLAQEMRTGAHLLRKALVQLFVQRHRRGRVQRRGQMDHKTPLLFGYCIKLTP